MADSSENPAVALNRLRWSKTTEEERLEVGRKLAEARRKARLARAKKRKKAKRR